MEKWKKIFKLENLIKILKLSFYSWFQSLKIFSLVSTLVKDK